MAKSKRKTGNVARRPAQSKQPSRPAIRKPSDIIDQFASEIYEMNREVLNMDRFITTHSQILVNNSMIPQELVTSFDSMKERLATTRTMVDEMLVVCAKMEDLDSVKEKMDLFIAHQAEVMPIWTLMQDIANELRNTSLQVNQIITKARAEQAQIDPNAPDAEGMFDPLTVIDNLMTEEDTTEEVEVEVDVESDDAAEPEDTVPSETEGEDTPEEVASPDDAPCASEVVDTPSDTANVSA